jgi:hypothetical protein
VSGPTAGSSAPSRGPRPLEGFPRPRAPQSASSWGKPLSEYTADDLREQFFTRKDCNDHCTVGCVRTCSHPDEWRGQHLVAPPQPLVQIRLI